MDPPPTSPETYNNGSSSSSLPVTATTRGSDQTLDAKAGQSSEILCGLCDERKETDEAFTVENCKHSLCADCLTKHVDSNIKDARHVVACPGLNCKSIIELEACIPMLPKSLVEKWNDSLFESLMREEQCKMCPKCTTYVQRNRGCLRITCRCHFQFCYSCGKEWIDDHRVSCQKDAEDD